MNPFCATEQKRGEPIREQDPRDVDACIFLHLGGWIFASAKRLGGKIGNGDEFFFNLAKNSGLGECFGYS